MTGRAVAFPTTPRAANPILVRLGRLATLSEAEQQILLQLGTQRERHRTGEELIAEGDTARRPRFILSGWAMAQRLLPDGRRQIFRFALPGDGLGVYPPAARPTLHAVVAATPVETVDAEPVLSLLRKEQAPGLLRAFAAGARLDDSRILDHMVRLARQTAYERVAHLLLELYERLAAVGLGGPQRFPLPLTQEMLSDALGLSIVHIKRTLQQMRREGLVEWRAGMATLLKRDLMVEIADYRPTTIERTRVI